MSERPDLDEFVRTLPRMDAVQRPSRFPGLASWGRRQWIAWAIATPLMFWAYSAASATATELPGSGSWTAALWASGAAAGFVLATYVPSQGQRLAFSPCAVMPLLLVALAPTLMVPGEVGTALAALGLLAVVGAQRALNVGCPA